MTKSQQSLKTLRLISIISGMCVAGAICNAANAGELSLMLTSVHTGDSNTEWLDREIKREFNENVRAKFDVKPFNNKNIGLTYKSDNGLYVSAYHNSLYKLSVNVGKSFDVTNNIEVAAGVVTGYNDSIMPTVAAHMNVGQFKITALPYMSNRKSFNCSNTITYKNGNQERIVGKCGYDKTEIEVAFAISYVF